MPHIPQHGFTNMDRTKTHANHYPNLAIEPLAMIYHLFGVKGNLREAESMSIN